MIRNIITKREIKVVKVIIIKIKIIEIIKILIIRTIDTTKEMIILKIDEIITTMIATINVRIQIKNIRIQNKISNNIDPTAR